MFNSEYNFNNEEDELDDANVGGHEEGINVEAIDGRPIEHCEDEIESEYAASEKLQSCSSTDGDMVGPLKPNYAEFREEIDMKDQHFKIRMKFRSFKQFREAVRIYDTKNRVVMKFRPSNNKRCKVICKKGCPFYLWASPMVKNKNTIQIKSGILKHECSGDHNIRHVNAKWISIHYLEQFRVDPSWLISGII